MAEETTALKATATDDQDWNGLPPEATGDQDGISPYFSLSPIQKRIWHRQETFLAAYSAANSDSAGLEAAGIVRRTLQLWRQHDTLGFNARYDAAHATFVDRLESKLAELALAIKPGQNPMPLIVALNAERPDKYRPNVQPTDERAQELLAELRKRARQERQEPGTKEHG